MLPQHRARPGGMAFVVHLLGLGSVTESKSTSGRVMAALRPTSLVPIRRETQTPLLGNQTFHVCATVAGDQDETRSLSLAA